MADIVTRLRDRAYACKAIDRLCEEAADEIERLDSLLACAMRQAGWVSVAEAPPTQPGRYIAWDGHSPWYYCEYDGQFLVGEGFAPITHWMPDSADNLDMRLEAVPDRLAQEVRRELDRLRWADKRNRNIIARIKAAMEGK